MSGFVVLGVCALVVLRGAWKRIPVYDAFLRGATEGAQTAFSLLPALCAMLLMLNLLRASGLLEVFTGWLTPLLHGVGLPAETAPVLLLRPLSGSGSLAALEQVIRSCGVDSHPAQIAAVLMGSSETIFYTLTVYLGATRIQRLPWVVPVSLMAYVAGALTAGWIIGS